MLWANMNPKDRSLTAGTQAEPPPPTTPTSDDARRIRRLMFYFGMVYVVEGIGQTDGIIAQPLTYYFKEVHSWTPVQVTAALTAFNLPWIVKPIYGLVSDFVPLFGYRRKSYLILASILATLAYLLAAQMEAPSQLLFVLVLTAYAMAIASTLCGALLVENGQRYGTSGAFVNQQWLWFHIAAMSSALIGGLLVQYLSPAGALHSAALIAGIAPLMIVFGTWFLIEEEKRPIDLPELKLATRGLLATFRMRSLWIVALFLFLYWFSPGFHTPLYYHMTDSLHFSQGYIGILGAISSAGSICGALVYRQCLAELTSKHLLQLSIVLGTATTAAFVLLVNEATAAALHFCGGVAAMIALVATLTLAADYCPKNSEGFTFAALMSITNLASALADNVGALLYQHAFSGRLAPLILLSAAFTALAWVLVPLLQLGDKPQGRAIAH
jgi:MFS family permease